MEIRSELQRNLVADQVSALVAVIRPILVGLLGGLKAEVVNELGGAQNVRLFMLSRLRRPGDGDVGICFEYAVHDAMRRGDPMVQERVRQALTLCRVPGDAMASILFAAEKTGSEQLIDTARDLVTPESRLLSGTRGQPALLQRHIDGIARALRSPRARATLPASISGVWKADLFIGATDTDRWVATTVKVNAAHLEGARGLRLGIVPVRQGETDAPHVDDRRNLIVCPLLYDGDFMQLFYEGWVIVQQFLAADAQLPREVALPDPVSRYVASLLVDRRDFPVLDVVAALLPLAQPELLETTERQAELILERGEETEVQAVVAPQAGEVRGTRRRGVWVPTEPEGLDAAGAAPPDAE